MRPKPPQADGVTTRMRAGGGARGEDGRERSDFEERPADVETVARKEARERIRLV